MACLNDEQIAEYELQGYLLVSGLIPDGVAADAEAAMWRLLGATADDPATWTSITQGHGSHDEPALAACYTPEMRGAAALLAGEDPEGFQAPRKAYAINVFPREDEWRWPGPHIDHAIKDHGHKTFPRAFRIATMTFLSDVSRHGGGTVVWPGSHRQLEALARSDPARYELMWALNQELGRANLSDPVELTPRRGDVLFYHTLCAHAGSMNTSPRPRLALNMKW